MKVQVQKLHTLTGHRDSVYTLQPSSEEHLFFSAAGDGMVVMWDQRSPEEGTLIAKLPNSIYALHYHPKSDTLIAGHNYDGIHVLDWKNKKEVGSLKLTTAAIFDIQSHEKYLFVATGEGYLIKVDSDNLIVKNQVRSSEKSARAISVNAARGEIAVGYSDYYIRVFDGYFDTKLRGAHKNSVFPVKYLPVDMCRGRGSSA